MLKAASLPQVRVNDRATKRLHGGHVWVYASDVTNEGTASQGALVHVLSANGKTLQLLTQAWDQPSRREAIISALQEFAPTQSLVEREDSRIRALEQLPPRGSAILHGNKSATVFTMNGVRFHYDALSGQKTGAF